MTTTPWINKTVPIADKDYRCCWEIKPPHIIPKGERYVRCVYKIGEKFESDHICLDCWVTWSKMYEKMENGDGTDTVREGHKETDS